jgi:gamma-glutamylaminecyclotransferase
MKIFVYGSLKSGKSHNHLLSESEYLYTKQTKNNYGLYVNTWFPALFENIYTRPTIGEIYEIDEKTLDRLDRFEGHPTLFKRKEIQLENDETVWCYFYQDSLEKDMKEIKIF